jgi:hypothetical protein
VSDIDTATVVDSLKVLDPEWPIREADILRAARHVSKVPKHKVAALQPAAREQEPRGR